ncbi:MAG: nucleotide exchange factor GrpE [Saprospiraceae bacterium]|nr:nucleotide exchange factor GrpE [Saprospiraceae bacterium]
MARKKKTKDTNHQEVKKEASQTGDTTATVEPAVEGEKGPELEKEVDELKDKYLRLLAEFDNYKKRTMKERLDLLRNASAEILTSILPILDDFDRAKKNADDETSEEIFTDGVQLVYNKLYQILQSKGLKAMDTDQVEFDPELHEAITKISAPNDELKGKILDAIEKGYYLNDKIIRHAKVVVGE